MIGSNRYYSNKNANWKDFTILQTKGIFFFYGNMRSDWKILGFSEA